MSSELVCWKCGEVLASFPKPYSRREVCPKCEAELHVCRMCRDFDPHVSDQCREDRAESPSQKDRANFCDFFEPASGAFEGARGADDDSRQALESLFSGGASSQASGQFGDDHLDELKKLFGED